MRKTFKLVGLEFDKPNLNHRIYSKEIVEKEAIRLQDDMEKNLLLATLDNEISPLVAMNTVCGLVKNIIIEKTHATADIEFLDTPKGLLVQSLLEGNNVEAIPVGYGKVDENGVVSDYIMVSVSLFPKPRTSDAD